MNFTAVLQISIASRAMMNLTQNLDKYQYLWLVYMALSSNHRPGARAPKLELLKLINN